MAEEIRVRLAPSPTGNFHIGTARTALFNYLFAKKMGGSFILRIEDTDKERSDIKYTKDIIDSLLWLGLGWDEGPEVGGAYGPYIQSERLGIYKKYLDQLLDEGKAYKCFCTTEELDKERAAQQAKGLAPLYSGKCRNLSAEQISDNEKSGRPFVIRFKTESKQVIFQDIIKGKVSFESSLIGDFTIARTDGMPLFVFVVVIDDHLMRISHVFRGEEHLSNAAKHILIAESLNILPPQFGHFPLILNPDRSKMSKRKNPVSVTNDYRDKGYLPEALVNFLSLLGWSPGNDREIFTLEELVEEFQIERVGKSPAIFDHTKLLWMNGYYIRQLPIGDLGFRVQSFISDKELLQKTEEDPQYFLKVVSLLQDRLKVLSEIQELLPMFYVMPKYDAALLVLKKSTPERTALALKAALNTLEELKTFTLDELENVLRSAAESCDLKAGELLWSVRVALSGKDASPGAFELLEVLGKEESLKRLHKAQELLSEL